VAYAYLKHQPGISLDIRDLHVDESHRRRGLGNRLLAEIMAIAAEIDIAKIWGGISRKDLRNSPFLLDWYRSKGFRIDVSESRAFLDVDFVNSVWFDLVSETTEQADGYEVGSYSNERPNSNGSIINMANPRDTAEELIQLGVEAKRRGNFGDAQKLYREAVEVAPDYLHGYYALGKLQYILGNREESILNYTVAAHIHVSTNAAQDFDEHIAQSKKSILSQFPEDLVGHFSSVHPYGILLLIDNNTPRHLAHSLIDLQEQADYPPALRVEINAYRDSISGKAFQQLDPELEDGMYHAYGADYLLSHIRWESIGKHPSNDVARLYKGNDVHPLAESSCEVLLKWVFDELRDNIGLKVIRAGSPFQLLIRELNSLVNDKSVSDVLVQKPDLVQHARQGVSSLLSSPFDLVCGPLVIQSLHSRKISRQAITIRWANAMRLVQTPTITLLFELSDLARDGRSCPILKSIVWALKNRKLISMRNALVHGTYEWGADSVGFVSNLNAQPNVEPVSIELCETFHGLIVICALALDRILRS
jgi:tetratricopeptide (TPR) repeat protein